MEKYLVLEDYMMKQM